MFHLIPLMIVAFLLAACGSNTSGSPSRGTDSGAVDLPVGGDTPTVSDARLPGCETAADCDDGVACTADSCASRVCSHTVVASRCPAGQVCDARRGCVPGHACAVNADCTDTDPCTVRERCDPAARVCLSDVLDGDGDGEPPRSCGGTDCDDSNPRAHATAVEACNGRDDNCNNQVDEGTDLVLCGRGMACQRGECVCTLAPTSGMRRGEIQLCNDSGSPSQVICTDVRSDDAHCGEFCNFCYAGSHCEMGQCTCGDRAQTYCQDRTCVNLQTDREHCGSCTTRCPADSAGCAAGVCLCPAGRSLCRSMGANECFDPALHQSDDLRCGACDNPCPSESHCVGGRCVCSGSGQTICGGTCTNIQTDFTNCGACGHRCEDGLSCQGGVCGCYDETTRCSTGCERLQDDVRNCGSCGHVCARMTNGTAPQCLAGECICQSDGSFHIWCSTPGGERCVDPGRDASHCGACGHACGPGYSCRGGTCECLGTVCGGTCITDLDSNPMHCGSCTNVCSSGTPCMSGRCTPMCPMTTFCATQSDCDSCRAAVSPNVVCCIPTPLGVRACAVQSPGTVCP